MAVHKLVFDATDADSQAASSNVGAYLRSADGTLLTHTDVGGKMALDVRVAEGINVEVDLDAADDSVASWTNDGAGNPISSTGGSLHVLAEQGTDPWNVAATDLDIRDLDSATDSVTAVQGTSPWVIGDGGGSITVDAVDLDIRNLVFATDKVDASGSVVALDAGTLAALESITVQNGAGAAAVNIQDGGNSITVDGTVTALQGTSPWVVSGTITTSDAALANTALKSVPETVGTSVGQIVDGADELAARKYLLVYNNGSKTAYIGQSGITTATGFPVPPGSILEARIGDAVDVYMIADAAAQNIRTLQLS